MEHNDFMRKAIALAVENVKNGGGPFGAVIVKDGEIVATGVNRVTVNNDPTAHAEVSAIREACLKLGTFDLSGCVLYTSCEPCPMCLGAIYWAHIDKIFYGTMRLLSILMTPSSTVSWKSLPKSGISRWRIFFTMRLWSLSTHGGQKRIR